MSFFVTPWFWGLFTGSWVSEEPQRPFRRGVILGGWVSGDLQKVSQDHFQNFSDACPFDQLKSTSVKDCKEVLKDAIATLRDPKAFKTKKKKADEVIETTVYQTMHIVQGVKRASPTSSSQYVHGRETVRKKREHKEKNPESEPKLAMLNEYIANGGSPDPSSEKQVATVTPPKQKGTNHTSS